MTNKLPDDFVVPAQFYGLKTVVTVMLDQWISVQKEPTEAMDAFTASLHSFVSQMDLHDVPAKHRDSFRAALRDAAMTVVESSRTSYPMEEPTSRQ
ncbi:MAG: hypothetical protein HYW28_09345 [Rhodospirillales bacterium]|nr:hypothetical protein [Rhodospirillales bacterium]